jgi:hypothetical protein
VCIGWVLFRAESLNHVGVILHGMVILTGGENLGSAEIGIALAAWMAVLLGHLAGSYVNINSFVQRVPAPIVATGMASVFLVVQVLMPHRGGAFIYFQF